MTMRRMSWLTAACVLGAAALPAVAQTKDLPLDTLAQQTAQALARLEFTVSNELATERGRGGQCICIDEQRGTFITGDLPSGVPLAEMTEFRLRQAGDVGPWYDAKLISIDPEENLAFLQLELKAGQKSPWKQLPMASSKNLKIGQRVVSVGLLPDRYGSPVYIGTAVIAGLFRLPDYVAVVTGGDLTVGSSPVLTTDGLMVGIVGGQLPLQARILLGGRLLDTALTLRDRTRYFIPTDEFAHIVRNIAPRRLPWLGTVSMEYVPENVAEDLPGLKGRAAVRIGRILANSPATNAGLKQSDVVVALNGKPLEMLPTPELTGRAFVRELNRLSPGTPIKLTVLRDGKDEELTLTLAPHPEDATEVPRYYDKRLGFAGRDMTRFEIETQTGTPKRGVAVLGVVPNSPAAAGRMTPGDLITHVNTREVRTVAELSALLKSLETSTRTINFTVIRRGVEESVIVAPPQPAP
ncbi:MAG TPA: PDZ domain-containing protein [Phycisphaerae bacterium]|nr:PDZ domain-containing protein [Phycisphaerae bacterium]HUU23248.1 PDZ domain-containing protein [Phycisphaerae bacterium]